MRKSANYYCEYDGACSARRRAIFLLICSMSTRHAFIQGLQICRFFCFWRQFSYPDYLPLYFLPHPANSYQSD